MDLLNDNQRRHFEVLFARLEEELLRLEYLTVRDGDRSARLITLEDDLPPDFDVQSAPLLARLRRSIRGAATLLHLRSRRVSRRRSIKAILTAATVRIEDSGPGELRGYGVVNPEFDREVGPALSEIKAMLMELSSLLRNDSPRRFGQP